MSQKPYNPCDDGFPAKVWECFRRNRALLADIEEAKRDKLEMFELWGSYDNPVTDAIRHRAKSPEETAVIIKLSWPEIPSALRDAIRRSLNPRDLKAVTPGSLEEIWEVRNIERFATLIEVPDFVFDTNHRRRLIAQFSTLLPKPIADSRWAKPNGRLLGKSEQWRNYLLTELWHNLGASESHAIDLAAREYYGQEKLRANPATTANAIRTAVKRKFARHKRFSKVEADQRLIERCISSVYPDFKLGSA